VKNIFLVTALLWTTSSEGQSLAKLKQLLQQQQFQPFNSYIIDVSSKTQGSAKIEMRQFREVAPGYKELMIDIEERNNNSIVLDQTGVSIMRLNLLASDSEIIYFEFKGRCPGRICDENFPIYESFKNEAAFRLFQLSFRSVFNVDPDLNELFRSYLYGKRCFAGADFPELRLQLIKLLKEKQVSTLWSWLISPNSEKQVYAVEGFYQLKENGYKIPLEAREIISYIKNKAGYIDVCQGCLLSNNSIKEVLASFVF